MALRLKNFHEKFIALHQSAVLLVGLSVITYSSELEYALFFLFGTALAPLFFAAFFRSHVSTESEKYCPQVRTYLMSSVIGAFCALLLAAMWLGWAVMEALRAIASTG